MFRDFLNNTGQIYLFLQGFYTGIEYKAGTGVNHASELQKAMQHNCNHLKKTKLSVIFMAMIGLLLSGCATECHCGNAFANVGRNISFEQMSKMPPFTATVESIDFDHPFFTSKTSVDLWLLKSDGPECLVAHSYPADKTTVSFVRNLEKGREYVFPQAYLDYVKTNAPIVERE